MHVLAKRWQQRSGIRAKNGLTQRSLVQLRLPQVQAPLYFGLHLWYRLYFASVSNLLRSVSIFDSVSLLPLTQWGSVSTFGLVSTSASVSTHASVSRLVTSVSLFASVSTTCASASVSSLHLFSRSLPFVSSAWLLFGRSLPLLRPPVCFDLQITSVSSHPLP